MTFIVSAYTQGIKLALLVMHLAAMHLLFVVTFVPSSLVTHELVADGAHVALKSLNHVSHPGVTEVQAPIEDPSISPTADELLE